MIRLLNNSPKYLLPSTGDWVFVAHGYFDRYGSTPPYEAYTPSASANGYTATMSYSNGTGSDDGDSYSDYVEITIPTAITNISAKKLIITIDAVFNKYSANNNGEGGHYFTFQINGNTVAQMSGGAPSGTTSDYYTATYLFEQTGASTISVTKLGAVAKSTGTGTVTALTSLNGLLKDVIYRINSGNGSAHSNLTNYGNSWSATMVAIPLGV